MRLLPEAENGQQGFVDAPLLLRTDATHKVSHAARIHYANLLDKDASDLTRRSISGRKDAALALRDVGATSTTERGAQQVSDQIRI
jgi:hypothetical protein